MRALRGPVLSVKGPLEMRITRYTSSQQGYTQLGVCTVAVQPIRSGSDSLSVCLYSTTRISTKTDKWIQLVFGMEASFHLSYAVLQGKSGNS